MTKPKVLVTGASGLIGGLVLGNLADRYEFSGLSRHAVPGIPYTEASITDLDAVRRAVAGQDMVLHLAGETKNVATGTSSSRSPPAGRSTSCAPRLRLGVRRVVLMSTGSTMCGWEWDDSLPYGRLAAGERDLPAVGPARLPDAAPSRQPVRRRQAVRRGGRALVLRPDADERAGHPARAPSWRRTGRCSSGTSRASSPRRTPSR